MLFITSAYSKVDPKEDSVVNYQFVVYFLIVDSFKCCNGCFALLFLSCFYWKLKNTCCWCQGTANSIFISPWPICRWVPDGKATSVVILILGAEWNGSTNTQHYQIGLNGLILCQSIQDKLFIFHVQRCALFARVKTYRGLGFWLKGY